MSVSRFLALRVGIDCKRVVGRTISDLNRASVRVLQSGRIRTEDSAVTRPIRSEFSTRDDCVPLLHNSVGDIPSKRRVEHAGGLKRDLIGHRVEQPRCLIQGFDGDPCLPIQRMRYGLGSLWERHDDRGSPSSDTT